MGNLRDKKGKFTSRKQLANRESTSCSWFSFNIITLYNVCSVHRGDIMSTSGGIMMHVRDTMSTSGEIMMHVGDTMSTSGDVQYIGGYRDACGGASW